MNRTALTDGSGRWFNEESAIKFVEETYFDGRNHISSMTGSQWDHETLYRTKNGVWILRCSSQWQGTKDTFEPIDCDAAYRWIVDNKCDFGMLDNATQAGIRSIIETSEV